LAGPYRRDAHGHGAAACNAVVVEDKQGKNNQFGNLKRDLERLKRDLEWLKRV
jgi:hypothetical protein